MGRSKMLLTTLLVLIPGTTVAIRTSPPETFVTSQLVASKGDHEIEALITRLRRTRLPLILDLAERAYRLWTLYRLDQDVASLRGKAMRVLRDLDAIANRVATQQNLQEAEWAMIWAKAREFEDVLRTLEFVVEATHRKASTAESEAKEAKAQAVEANTLAKKLFGRRVCRDAYHVNRAGVCFDVRYQPSRAKADPNQ